jgi:hypothetical protein
MVVVYTMIYHDLSILIEMAVVLMMMRMRMPRIARMR